MWVNNITINEFRAFQNEISINLSKHITCISGHNGIGKSTILAILSNCGELKTKFGKHINGSAFRGEFSDIIIGDRNHDSPGDKAKLKFSELPSSNENDIWVDELEFRALFQKERYRLIPKKVPNIRNTESKLKWPTYYLGLSRLYPVGESKEAKFNEIPNDIAEILSSLHADILSLNYGTDVRATNISISEISKKKIGFEAKEFSSTANSSGQDNLGQILLSVLSFEKLKREQPTDYYGGMLLIDELDATLHPAAQRKLFDFLYKKSLELNLQIVFTTHSLSLLEYITSFKLKNRNTTNVKISYLLRRDSGILEKENPQIDYFKNDLNDTYTGIPTGINKVKILTEDKIARWFITQLLSLSKTSVEIDLLDINISWGHLVNLMVSDIEVFKNYIAILDPDLNDSANLSKLNDLVSNYPFAINDNKPSNFLILPSNPTEEFKFYNIEESFWHYILNISDTHVFFDDPIIEKHNWSKRLIIDTATNQYKYDPSDRKKMNYKHWFNDHQYFIDILIKYWYYDNQDLVAEFIDKFKAIYYKIYNNINS